MEADRWIRAVEIRPTNRRVAHHAVLFAGGTNDRMFRAFDAKNGIVKFKSDVTFATGSAEVTANARQAVQRFAQILNSPDELKEIYKSGSGTIRVAEDGTVSGIFSDGDLRRLILHDQDAALRRPVREVMTANPKRIRGDQPYRTIADMYFARGFAEMQMAQDFCNGIPLSRLEGDDIVGGEPLPVAEVFQRAIASFEA
mgnify:CR=1 FL=1